MEEEIQPILVIALLEHEGISNLTNDKPRPGHRARTGSNDNNLDAPGKMLFLTADIPFWKHSVN